MSRIKSIQGRSLVLICLALLSACILSACGGGSNATGETTVPDLKLTALTIEGHDIAFESDKRAGYTVNVDQPVETAVFTATAQEGATLTYTLRSVANPTGTFAGTELVSGEATTINLDEGDNVLSIRVRSSETTVAVTYTVTFHRVSSEAKLNGIVFYNKFDASLSTTSFIQPYTPTFDSATKEYTASVNSAACSLRTRLLTNQRLSTATINGEAIGHLESRNFAIVEGDNTVEIAVTSEDGANTESYSFTFTRATMSDETRAANARLIDLQLSDSTINFECGTFSYGAVVSYDNQVVTLTAVPEIDGITMTLAKVAEDGTIPDGDDQPLNSPIELTLEEGINSYVLETTSTDGTETVEYNLSINRISRNIVNVTTAEELQEALKNAAPRDEIRVAAGTYTGVVSEAASGNLSAHFYSAQSGTADNLIRLVGQGSGSILSGADTALNSVLQLEGDYWFVSNIAITNAQTGIVLDAASNNELFGLDVKAIGGQGVLLRNGSSNNFIQSSRFATTGGEAIVVGSDSEQWLSAPGGAGMYSEADLNNTIRSNTFSSTVAAESVEVNEGAEGTLIEYNFFNSGSLSGEAGADSLVLVQGNDSVVRFNTFTHTADASLASVIEVQDASADWHTDSWGVNTKVNDNILLLNGLDVPAVTAGAENTVFVANNTRDGELPVAYVGDAINSSSLASPVFEIRTADVADQCLGFEEFETVQYVKILACDSSATQRWNFVRDAEGFVRIQNVGMPELFARPVRGFTSRCSTAVDSFVYGGVTTEGFLQRWLPSFRANNLYLLNKENTGFAITSGTVSLEVDSYVVACPAIFTTNQRLSLVEVE